MSLKYDIEEYPEMWSNEIVAAVEDYKNGKWNSERKLRKFVNREISEYYYNELIQRYSFFHRMNRAKLERMRSQKINRALCIILAIVVMLSSTESSLDYLLATYGEESVVCYFFLYVWAVFYAFAYDPNSDLISKLKIENTLLKDKLETYEAVKQKHGAGLVDNGSNIEMRNKENEIANLKKEIVRLENIRESDNKLIELLKNELEKARNNLQ